MRVFKDNAGRTWEIVINVSVIRRVKAHLDIDLLDAVGGDLAERLAADPVMLVDMLYVICKPAADAAGVSDEEFGAALVGDAIDAASTALLEALMDFFPSRRRALLKKLAAKGEAAVERMLAEMEKAADDEGLEDRILAALNGGLPSTDGPDSRESQPTSSQHAS
jgi:hypothetical protein